MGSRLEIQPERFAVVIGSQFAARVVQELRDCGAPSAGDEGQKLPTFNFKNIVNRGVSYLLEKESFPDEAARAKFEARYSNAYELDPFFVLRKITSSLRASCSYGEWLAELFACPLPSPLPSVERSSASLERLLALQSRGALLVYLHCDEIVARAAGQETLVLEDDLERWASGEERTGILQPHGVYSRPDSVQLDGQLYDGSGSSEVGRHQPGMERLERALRGRSILLLGDEWAALDPLFANFCRRFVGKSGEEDTEAVVLNTAGGSAEGPLGLPLCTKTPLPAVHPMTGASSDLWKQINITLPVGGEPNQYKVVCLLVATQTGARDVSHMMFGAPGVNFALVSTVNYRDASAYSVLLRVSSASLKQLWKWLLTSSREALLSSGLVGLGVYGGAILWLRDQAALSSADEATPRESAGTAVTNSEDMDTHGPLTGNENTLSSLTDVSPPTPSSQDNDNSSLKSRPKQHHHHQRSKIIQRYKVVKKRSSHQLMTGAHSGDGYGGLFMSKTCEEPGVMYDLAHTGGSSSKYARRGSLPPIKCGEAGNALALFAERLQTSSINGASPGSLPSYVAIKRALLSDKFKGPISRLVAPKTLLNLLQAKKMSVNIPAVAASDKSNLVAHRRNSDPGSYLQHRDKTRRRQLFLDENLQWSKTYGSVIEQKIQAWRQKRLLRMQRELFLQQQQQQQSELQLMNTAKLVSGQLYASLASSSSSGVPSSFSALPQAFVTAAGAGVNGFSPTPLMYQLPSTGLTPTPVLVPTPFVSPYAFMGGYATIPSSSHPTAAAYIMPSTAAFAAAAAAAGSQPRVMLLPSGTACSTSNITSPPLVTIGSDMDTKPPSFSSLLAPTKHVAVEHDMDKQGQNSVQLMTNSLSLGSRKRKNSFPEKLSSLLQPASEPDPSSLPSRKRCCPDTGDLRRSSVSPPPPSHSHTHTSSHSYHSSHHSSSSHNSSHHHSHHHSHHRHRHHHTHHSPHHHTASSHHHHSPSSPLSHPHKPSSPLEQCLLQPPSSPCSDSGRMTDSAGYSSASSPSSDYSGHPSPQLWQFLLDLLLTADCSHLIQWTSHTAEEYEFTIHQPAQVAQLWGKFTNNSAMNYDKLARGLRYYYSKGIIEKVEGKKLTFRYNGLARSYVQQRCRQAVDVNSSSMEEMVVVE